MNTFCVTLPGLAAVVLKKVLWAGHVLGRALSVSAAGWPRNEFFRSGAEWHVARACSLAEHAWQLLLTDRWTCNAMNADQVPFTTGSVLWTCHHAVGRGRRGDVPLDVPAARPATVTNEVCARLGSRREATDRGRPRRACAMLEGEGARGGKGEGKRRRRGGEGGGEDAAARREGPRRLRRSGSGCGCSPPPPARP